MREATREDLLELLRMSREFAKAIDRPLDREILVASLESMIDSEDALVLVDEGAMAAALLYPSYMDGHLTCQELWFWVDEDKRGQGVGSRLLDSIEGWAEMKGATEVLLTATQKLTPRKLGKLYRERGYAPQEHVYFKRVG